MPNENILNSIRNLGIKVLPKGTRLILFGSQARGDVHTELDWAKKQKNTSVVLVFLISKICDFYFTRSP